MDINQNTLIQSTDNLKEQKMIIKNTNNYSEINNNKKVNNNNNLEIHNYLTKYKTGKNTENNSSIITSNIIDKNDKKDIIKENNFLNNEPKYINSYKSENNLIMINNFNNLDDSSRKVIKNEITKKNYKTYKINRKNDEVKGLNLQLKINKKDNDKDNILTQQKCIEIINNEYNSINENMNKINIMHSINGKDSVKQMTERTKDFSNNYLYNNNQEYNYKCLFCDKIYENSKYTSLFNCEHFFCKKCGKIFYEEIIENMIKNNTFNLIECPIINCANEVPLPLLQIIISEKYYNELIEHLNKNNKKFQKSNHKKEIKVKKELNIMSTTTENYEKKKKNKNINFKNMKNNENHKYLQKSIIDLNSYKKYTYFIFKSFEICPSCQEYSLYRKIEGNYDKCLKCLKKYCKYCYKEFEDNHLDITKIHHCKIFYRAYKDYIQHKCYYQFLYNLILIIGGYLFFLTFFILQIKRALKIRNILEKIIKIFLYFILFISFFPICIILLPYFPMIISL